MEIQSDWKVCPSCKNSLEKEKCSKCDRELEIGWVVCPFCPQPPLPLSPPQPVDPPIGPAQPLPQPSFGPPLPPSTTPVQPIPLPSPSNAPTTPPPFIPAQMTAGMPTSSSNLWHPLFVKDSVYRWEGKKGATLLKAKIGRLIIAKEGVIFVSSGSNKIGSQFGKALIPIVGTLMAATSGASTVNLDSTDLSKVGSMKIPKSELTSFLVEGGFMSGRYLRIYTRSQGDYSFMTKIGFNKSDVQILKQLDNIDMW